MWSGGAHTPRSDHDGPVASQRRRLSPGDDYARTLLRGLPDVVSRTFIATLKRAHCLALARYGAQTPVHALRRRSPELLAEALLATAIFIIADDETTADPRDVMTAVALHYVVAIDLDIAPEVLFTAVAGRLPHGVTADLLRQFGARTDVTARAFGLRRVETTDGPAYV
jgi:hypothetical protein